jgi:hypothetical protein
MPVRRALRPCRVAEVSTFILANLKVLAFEPELAFGSGENAAIPFRSARPGWSSSGHEPESKGIREWASTRRLTRLFKCPTRAAFSA